ncbi:Leucine zipper protein 1 [Merluccius polli]|uniref:Leucine zipper protein 1 n=1 Tax=Merluccius polli TaxID=89951 RepID=A0AA47MGJ1_MERPO|nr:Leucine zipper protein 1 [Merluccius polli]
MSEHKDMTNRHLRHKLQSLGRRLDELEEATNKLQKSEDELVELQDKIIQAEGSNSSLLDDVEALRKRLLKIQGKDEEVRKAEDLCRTVREKLEEEEGLTKELKAEIERLQRRMAELEKLEEAFGKSKSDCSQLCLSLNEEKNLTKKLSSELETLKARLKEMETSEAKLDRAEQALAAELDKLKGFTQSFVSERRRLLDRQRDNEKNILKLTEKVELQKKRIGTAADPGDIMRSCIEDELSTGLYNSKLNQRKRSLDYLKSPEDNIGLRNKSENEKNSSLEGPREEDNKVKELTQEVERLKNRLKQLEIVEEDLKNSESKNGELQEKFQVECNRARQLGEQVEQLRLQLCGNSGMDNGGSHGNRSPNTCPNTTPAKVLENGKAENEEINVKGGFRQEKPKHRSPAVPPEPGSPKHKNRELSPQHKRETKLRSRVLSHSEESSPKTTRRAVSPAHKPRRTPKTPMTTTTPSDNGVRETGRGMDEKTRASPGFVSTSSGEGKKASVLSRYPPAANDQKHWKTAQKQTDVESKKSKVETFSKLYAGSDSESNNSDVVPESYGKANSISAQDKDSAFALDQELLDPVQESVTVPLSASKANGSYTAYRSNVTATGSEGHSSASETESTGSRPSEPEPVSEVSTATTVSSRTAAPKYPRYSRVRDPPSEGSSTRSSFDEELHSRPLLADGGIPEAAHTPSGIEIRRVCSPREALRSKAIIKPAIVESDQKEVMMSEPLASNGKPKISTKPMVTTTSKMTSSITIYPNDPGSSRTSSRSSSVSSEPMVVRERHTSTSNILIGSSMEHRGSISIPYEISIPKSDIPLRASQDNDEYSPEDRGDPLSRSGLHDTSRMDTTSTSSRLCSQRSSFSILSPEATTTSTADFSNDTESGFESSSSCNTTSVSSWRSQTYGLPSQDDSLPDLRNVTVRNTWRNRPGATTTASMDQVGIRGKAVPLAPGDCGGSDDEAADPPITWRAYRANSVLDQEETGNGKMGAGSSITAPKGAKPSPAELYMRNVNNATGIKEVQDSGARRGKTSPSPSFEAAGLGRAIAHEPLSSQMWGRSYSREPAAAERTDASPDPRHSPASWRRQPPTGDSYHLGSSYDRGHKTAGLSPRGEPWSSRGQGSADRGEGRSGAGSRPWNRERQADRH